MTDSKYGRILSIVTSILAVLLGVTFIICCAHLYYTGGTNPYSADRVGKYLSYLLIPSLLTLVAVVLGLIYNIKCGISTDDKIKNTSSYLLANIAKRCDEDALGEDKRTAIYKERTLRKTVKYTTLALSSVCYVISVVYIVFFSKFTIENMTGDIISALTVSLPIALIGVLINIPATTLMEKSAMREIELLKGEKKVTSEPEEPKKALNYPLITRAVIVCVAVVFIVLGIFNGGMYDVLNKAIKICTECIGLG